jgi:uncharacterized protein YuzB (UPF0349 family)
LAFFKAGLAFSHLLQSFRTDAERTVAQKFINCLALNNLADGTDRCFVLLRKTRQDDGPDLFQLVNGKQVMKIGKSRLVADAAKPGMEAVVISFDVQYDSIA